MLSNFQDQEQYLILKSHHIEPARFEQSQAGLLVEKISNISVPTLILWGGRDKLIPAEIGRRFAQDIPGSQLVEFAELGHIPHEEAPQKTALAVKEFLQGQQ